MFHRLSLSWVGSNKRRRSGCRRELRQAIRSGIRPVRLRPQLELLEDRALMAVVTWDGGAGTYEWGDALNWSSDTVPGIEDDVKIGDLAGTPTITITADALDLDKVDVKSIQSLERISVGYGVLMTVDGESSYRGLDFAQLSSFDSNSLQVLQGNSQWYGSNHLVAPWKNEAKLTIESGLYPANFGSIENLGELELKYAAVGGYPSGLRIIDVNIANRFGAQTYLSAMHLGTGSTITNEGLLIADGSVELESGTTLDNIGQLTVQGSLQVNGEVSQMLGSTLTGGSWTVKGLGYLNFSDYPEIQVIEHDATVTLAGVWGQIDFIQNVLGTLVLERDFETAGPLRSSGNLQVGALSTLTVPSYLLQSDGITHLGFNPNFGGTIQTPLFKLNGGELRGFGRIAGSLENNQGTVSPGGDPIGGSEPITFSVNDIGTITVGGEYSQGSEASLSIQITPSPSVFADQLVIEGGGTFDGALQLEYQGRYLDKSESTRFITTGFGFNGFFDHVISPQFDNIPLLSVNASGNDIYVAGAVLVVRNVSGSGSASYSLPYAMARANDNPDPDIILFDLGGSGATIAPTSPLPTITTPIQIRGDSPNGGFIELTGIYGQQMPGFEIVGAGASGSSIRGFWINHFDGSGVVVRDATNVVIQDNTIEENSGSGIEWSGDLIEVRGLGALDAMVSGGMPSTTATSSVAQADLRERTGGYAYPTGNWPFDNEMPGRGGENYGFVATGTLHIAQGGIYSFAVGGDDGVRLEIDGSMVFLADQEQSFTVGYHSMELTPGDHTLRWSGFNSIGSSEFEISVADGVNTSPVSTVNGWTVLGVADNPKIYLSTPLSVTAYYPNDVSSEGRIIGNLIFSNARHGIEISELRGIEIGGAALGGPSANVVHSNGQSGVSLVYVKDSIVSGNTIGLDDVGIGGFGNSVGIRVGQSSSNVEIVGNEIADNDVGIRIQSAMKILVQSNVLGLERTSHTPRPNGTGIEVSMDQGSTISRNTIGSSTDDGILIVASETSSVEQNLIGMNADGSAIAGVEKAAVGVNVRDSIGVSVESNTIAAAQMGIDINDSSYTRIQSNLIGLSPGGDALGFANDVGVTIHNYSEGTQFKFNTVSNSRSDGVAIFDGANGTVVAFNTIGTDPSGSTDLGNGKSGISIVNAIYTQIESNLISGNDEHGVSISSSVSTRLIRNRIGLARNGTDPLPNQGSGIFCGYGANQTSIGGDSDSDGNIIAFNLGNGIEFQGVYGVTGNQVVTNRIGVTANGMTAAGNGGFGVLVVDSPNIVIGRDSAGLGNLISGNERGGVAFLGSDSSGGTVQGNWIGVDSTGLAALPNGGFGVYVGGGPWIGASSDAYGIAIGGGDELARNIISGNVGPGIWLAGGRDNIVAGNYLGTDTFGVQAIPNQVGILISNGSHANFIGGATTYRNVISGNATDGVRMEDAGTTNNILRNNWIGIDATGSNALGNGGFGVVIEGGAAYNILLANVISGNGLGGVRISDAGTNSLYANRIGTAAVGEFGLGNGLLEGGPGVWLSSTVANEIGSDDPSAGNVISGNGGDGIRLTGVASGNRIRGNTIGSDVYGHWAIPNQGNGIAMDGPGVVSNVIGGDSATSGNLLSNNLGAGLRLAGNTSKSSSDNRFGQNLYQGNIGLAIDIAQLGPTLNDDSDSDEYLNAPLITAAYFTSLGKLVLEGWSRPNRSIVIYQSAPTTNGRGQGNRKLFDLREGSSNDLDPSVGAYSEPGIGFDAHASRFHFEFTLSDPAEVSVGDLLVGLHVGSTSEFGNAITVGEIASNLAPVVTLSTGTVSSNAGAGLVVAGSYLDWDSTSWTGIVDYGDGSAVEPLFLSTQRTFTLRHRYESASETGEPWVATVYITDNGGLTGTATLTVNVENEAPVVQADSVRVKAEVAEGDSVNLIGSFTDSDLTEEHFVDVDWGDGVVTSDRLEPGQFSFSLPHRYLDDGVSNTTRDPAPIRVVVRDSHGGSTTPYSVLVTEVVNVPPSSLVLESDLPIDADGAITVIEGTKFTLHGSFYDPGILDSHFITIDWGDGSELEKMVKPSEPGQLATRAFEVHHSYADNPSNLNETYTVTAYVHDDDDPLAPIAVSQRVRVLNALPVIESIDISSSPIQEDQEAELSIAWSDVGLRDAHTLKVDWGDGSQPETLHPDVGTRLIEGLRHQYLDNRPGGLPYSIVVSIADDDMAAGDFVTSSVLLQVDNVAPVASPVTLFVRDASGNWVESAPGVSIDEGSEVRIVGGFSDQGSRDTHSVRVKWSDGEFTSATVDATNRTYEAIYRYRDDYAPGTSSDLEIITATVMDNDGGSDVATTQVLVNNVAPIASYVPLPTSTATSVQLKAIVTDPGDENFTYLWTITAVGGSGPGIVLTPEPTEDAIFTFNPQLFAGAKIRVRLEVADDDGGTSTFVSSFLFGSDDPNTPDRLEVHDDDFVDGVSNMTVMSFAGNDILDASTVTAGHQVILDGGSGVDYLFGGSGNDTYILRAGNDLANVLPDGVTNIQVNEDGDDTYVLTPNSTLTIKDNSGQNNLDFSRANIGTDADPLGIHFDLSQINTEGFVVEDVGKDTDVVGAHFVKIQGLFESVIGSAYGDTLTGSSGAKIFGGDGEDRFFVPNGMSGGGFFGGADADVFVLDHVIVGSVDFEGDSGADVFQVKNSTLDGIDFGGGADADVFDIRDSVLTGIDFGGGADADVFLVSGSNVFTSVDLQGDSGADTLDVTGTVIGQIDFGGGADADVLLLRTGGTVGSIDFEGDSGADVLNVGGTVVGRIDFGGGADADALNIGSGGSVGSIDFSGDSGADVLNVGGTVVGRIDFGGGADADGLILTGAGSVGSIDFEGDSGADVLSIGGTVVGRIDFGGGADADVLVLKETSTVGAVDFEGDSGADVFEARGTVLGNIDFGGGADADALVVIGTVFGGIDFGGGADADALTILGTIHQGVDFEGDSGADVLDVRGTVVGQIDFGGGADADVLVVRSGGTAGGIDFEGDSGADTFVVHGTVIGGIDFSGGADANALTIGTTGSVGSIDFEGDTSTDTLVVVGTVIGSIDFEGDSGADGLLIGSTGTVGSIDFTGDSGADVLDVRGTVIGNIDFGGGADGDALVFIGTVGGGIDFEGDAGDDRLSTSGKAHFITFVGGEGSDTFRNDSSNVQTIKIFGFEDPAHVSGRQDPTADGADLFYNYGSSIAEIQFIGGIGDDVFYTQGNNLGALQFQGDSGADVFIVSGVNIGSIDFGGGADSDALSVTGTLVGNIDFNGDINGEPAGNDIFINTSTGRVDNDGNPTSAIHFAGGEGDDLFRNSGEQWHAVVFRGGDGRDRFQNTADRLQEIFFDAGGDNDLFQNTGNDTSGLVMLGGEGDDVFVNSGDRGRSLVFFGGAGNDQWLNTGVDVQDVWFVEESGNNRLSNSGARLKHVVYQGGSSKDVFYNGGTASEDLVLLGNAGEDSWYNDVEGGLSEGLRFLDHGAIGDPGMPSSYDLPTPSDTSIVLPSVPRASADSSRDVFANRGGNVLNIEFDGGAGNDFFQNSGSCLTGVDFEGGDGEDTALNTESGIGLTQFTFYGGSGSDVFQNDATDVDTIRFYGGDGNDALYQYGDRFGEVFFSGGDGIDILANSGDQGNAFRMIGGDGADRFQNQGKGVNLLDFEGGDGADALQNTAAEVGAIWMLGGSGADTLINSGNSVRWIRFAGEDGDDSLVNTGSGIGGGESPDNTESGITFDGGSGIDVLRTQGVELNRLTFEGGEDSDTLIYNTTLGGTVLFYGGDGDDRFVLRGSAVQLTVELGAGADSFTYAETAVSNGVPPIAVLDGGAGDDMYDFVGSPQGRVIIREAYSGLSDESRDRMDFSSYLTGAIHLDLAVIEEQELAEGFSIQFEGGSQMGMEDVVGTRFGDVIYGNDRANKLFGAQYLDDAPTVFDVPQRESQWVYLDFDSATGPGEYIYSTSDRKTVSQGLQRAYYGLNANGTVRSFESPERWFNVRFALSKSEIPVGIDFVTIRFNDTPPDGSPGGLSSEVDPGNLNYGGTAWVQVHGLLGGTALAPAMTVSEQGIRGDFLTESTDGQLTYGQRNPDNTVENFLALSIKISAHELGHLIGLRHYDSFGPIGTGVHTPPGTDEFNPAYTGLVEAYETFSHLISSPASVGSDRKNDVGSLFFGEREAIKLSYAMLNPTYTTINESSVAKSNRVNAQPIQWVTIPLPNTLATGLNVGKDLYAQVLSVDGSIGIDPNTQKSEDDYYSFQGKKGDLMTLEVHSKALKRFTNPNGVTTIDPNGFIDSRVRVLDATGAEIPYYQSTAFNDDEFESSDSLLIDVNLPSDGVYFVVVDSFSRDRRPSDPTDLSGLDPVAAKIFTDAINDTDTGNYELFAYRFARNTGDQKNLLVGRGGQDELRGTSQEKYGVNIDTSNLPQQLNGTEIDPVLVHVGFTDIGGNSWVARIDYDNDGNIDLVVDGVTKEAGLDLNHRYPDNGDYRMTVTITNDDGQSDRVGFDVHVANTAPTARIVNTSSIFEGGTVDVQFQDIYDPSSVDLAAGLRYSFSLAASGLASSYASASQSSSTSFLIPDNLPNDASYTIYGRIFDKDGGFTNSTSTVVVVNVAPTASFAGVTSPAIQGQPVSVSINAYDPGGIHDPLSYRFTLRRGTTIVDQRTQSVGSYGFTPTAYGDYGLEVVVADDDGGEVTISRVISVQSPFTVVVDPPADGYQGVPGQERAYRIRATSPGTTGAFRYEIDWKDGSALEVIAAGNADQVVTHRFLRGGTFAPKVTAVNSNNDTARYEWAPIVVSSTEVQGSVLAIGLSDGGSEDDVLEVTALPTVGCFQVSINSGSQTEVVSPGAIMVFGGAGNDRLILRGNGNAETFQVTGTILTYNGTTAIGLDGIEGREVQAMGGDDVISIVGDASATVSGGDGQDELRMVASVTANEWRIDAANTGRIFASGQTLPSTTFNGVESLTGSDVVADRFVFAAGSSLSGSLNGGSGVGIDEINVSALTGSVNFATKKVTGVGGTWSSLESFVSTGGTLTGADVNTSWLVSGDRMGTAGYQEASISYALSFAGFSTLQGGSQADVFTFGTLGRVTTVFGGAGLDRLVGPDLAVNWIVTEAGGGSLLNSVSFKQFENLQGGASADRFQVRPAGSLTGNIDAGAGENVLDYTLFTTAINVDLTSGMLKGTNVGGLTDSFALVMGGSGADTIKGSTTRSMILVGNGGNDALWGGAGNDILVGGLGADTLRGQGGQDILIGGRVLYDTTIDGLISIWREWSRSDTNYGGRINHLMGTTSNGLNGTYYLRNKLSATDPLPGTLPDDTTVDTLFGGGDTDWFISATTDLDSDIVSGETKTAPGKLTW